MIKLKWRKAGIVLVLCLFFIVILTAFTANATECASKWTLLYRNTNKEATWRSITHSSVRSVAVGDTGLVSTSTDGIHWYGGNSLGISHYGVAYGVVQGSGKYIAVGWDGYVRTSSNGINWSTDKRIIENILLDVCYDPDKQQFVAVGEKGGIAITKNGTTWDTYSIGDHEHPNDVVYGNGLYVASGGSGKVYTSTNGKSWSKIFVGNEHLFTAVYGKVNGIDTYVVAGNKGVLYTSNNGQSWSVRDSKSGGNNLWSGVYTGSKFVIVGEYNKGGISSAVITSNYGQYWVRGDSKASHQLLGLDYNPYFGIINARGVYGTLIYSECSGGPSPTGIDITSPSGGERWEIGSTHNITWSSSGAGTYVKLEYSTNNGSTWTVFDASSRNDGVRPWIVDVDNLSDQCKIKISSTSNPGIYDISEAFTITGADNVVITTPNGGETWAGGSTQNITWDINGTVGNLKIEYSCNNGASYHTIISSTDNDGTYTWNIPKTIDSNQCIIRLSEVGGMASDVSDNVFTITSPPEIGLDKNQLNFGYSLGNTAPGAQPLGVLNNGGGTINWTIAGDQTWLNFNPGSGAGATYVDVSVNPTNLGIGTYTATITVSDPNSSNLTHTAAVNLTVKRASNDQNPFGDFATPGDGVTVDGSIPVTGWVLDDIEVTSLKIYYNNSSFIGDAVFVEGARPDIEQAYPLYPQSSRAGWGYMMLTNALPDGAYKLSAIATDNAGHQVTLGEKNIIINNADAVKPFGAIDTPFQGGEASGSKYVNWGWALTPLPNTIPTDGSTISIWVDSVSLGKPYAYNIPNANVAALFPQYNNSNGPTGYLHIDTTQYLNGVHTIAWTVTDNAGNREGIGSRYFSIWNTNTSTSTGGTCGAAAQTTSMVKYGEPSEIPVDYSYPVRIKKGYNQHIKPQEIYPDKQGFINVESRELERIEIQLNPLTLPASKTQPSIFVGYLVVGDELRPLPIGSLIDSRRGVFSWQPGHGFFGCYEFVFIGKCKDGPLMKKKMYIKITPKFPMK